MRITRLLATTAVLAAWTFGFTSAASGDGAVTLNPTAEAWYQPNPLCGTPLGCTMVVPPPVSAYPTGTLHVGVSRGQETARTYMAFPLRSVLDTITSAVLTLPVDTEATDGDSASATAHLVVCLTQAPIERVEGSFGPLPSTDCSGAAPAQYVPAPKPHFAVDLAPALDRLAAATGVVILPDATKVAPADSWRVVFSAHDRGGAAAPPATLAVTTESLPDDALPADDVFLPGFSASLVDPPVGTGFAAARPLPLSISPISAPAPAGPIGDKPAPIASTRYRYKAVWLLPLVLIALAQTTVKALTKDLTPRQD